MKKIKYVIIEDNPDFRNKLKGIISCFIHSDKFELVGEIESTAELNTFLETPKNNAIDLFLIDYKITGGIVYNTINKINEYHNNPVKIIISSEMTQEVKNKFNDDYRNIDSYFKDNNLKKNIHNFINNKFKDKFIEPIKIKAKLKNSDENKQDSVKDITPPIDVSSIYAVYSYIGIKKITPRNAIIEFAKKVKLIEDNINRIDTGDYFFLITNEYIFIINKSQKNILRESLPKGDFDVDDTHGADIKIKSKICSMSTSIKQYDGDTNDIEINLSD